MEMMLYVVDVQIGVDVDSGFVVVAVVVVVGVVGVDEKFWKTRMMVTMMMTARTKVLVVVDTVLVLVDAVDRPHQTAVAIAAVV